MKSIHPQKIIILSTRKLRSAKLSIKTTRNFSPRLDKYTQHFYKTKQLEFGLFYLLGNYNCISSNDVFPNKWHEAIVINPRTKTPKKFHSDSYKPIVFTNKLLEKILNKSLQWYLKTNNLLERNQIGFRKYEFIIDSLIKLDSNICEAFLKKPNKYVWTSKRYTICFRDAKFSNDSTVGPKRQYFKFIANFLKNRYIYVCINGKINI